MRCLDSSQRGYSMAEGDVHRISSLWTEFECESLSKNHGIINRIYLYALECTGDSLIHWLSHRTNSAGFPNMNLLPKLADDNKKDCDE